jgi:hypothetical protein
LKETVAAQSSILNFLYTGIHFEKNHSHALIVVVIIVFFFLQTLLVPIGFSVCDGWTWESCLVPIRCVHARIRREQNKKKGKKGLFIYYLFPFFFIFWPVYFHLLLFVAAVGVPATSRE